MLSVSELSNAACSCCHRACSHCHCHVASQGTCDPLCHGGSKKLLFDLCPIFSSVPLFLLIFNLNLESLIEKYYPRFACFPRGNYTFCCIFLYLCYKFWLPCFKNPSTSQQLFQLNPYTYCFRISLFICCWN